MHRNPVVTYQTGPSPALHVILVHGRTLDPSYMQALADRIGLPDVAYIFPAADGNTWYPKSFLAPLAENQPHLDAAIAHYEAVVTELLARVPPSRLIVGGFSQGACLTAEYLHRHPRRLAAGILWTGGLIGPDGTEWTPRRELAGTPVYLTTSETDPFVPPSRVRQTVTWLSASGASVTAKIFSAREHEVSDEEILAARNLFTSAMAAARRTA